MNRFYSRSRDLATGAVATVRTAAAWRRPLPTVLAGATATALAIGAGIWWGLAGTAPSNQVDAAADPPQGPILADASPGSTDPGSSDSAVPGSAGNPGSAGGGPGTSGSSGGGPAPAAGANRPPVIEDMGLSSDGLTVTVTPSVTDPDGDELSVQVTIDGEPAELGPGGSASMTFPRSEVDYVYGTVVSVTVTDSHGATASDTASTLLEAVTTVTVRDVRFRVVDPAACFQPAAARRLTGALLFTGAVTGTAGIDQELRADRSNVTLMDSRTGEVVGAEPVQTVALAGGQFAGISDIANTTHRPGDSAPGATIAKILFRASGACEGWLSYKVDFRTR